MNLPNKGSKFKAIHLIKLQGILKVAIIMRIFKARYLKVASIKVIQGVTRVISSFAYMIAYIDK